LILSLSLIVLIIAGVSSYICVDVMEEQLVDAVVTGAGQLAGSLKSATWHAMMADHKEDAYRIMQSIGERHGIERIRMIDKEGRIVFSTVESDLERLDLDAASCRVCHSGSAPEVEPGLHERARIVGPVGGPRALQLVAGIYNEPSCSTAACHAHSPERTMLGVLDLTVDLEHVDAEIRGMKLRRALIALAEILFFGVFVALFVTRFVSAPIRKLIEGTQAVSAMRLDTPIEVRTDSELGDLADSFEAMRVRLKEAVARIESFTQELERKVEERSEQLQTARMRLVQSERMASLGQLAASVAHEINNPVSGVSNLATVLQRLLEQGRVPEGREEEIRSYLTQIQEQTTRVGRIVSDLLSFSRRSSPQSSDTDLNEVVDKTVTLVAHKLELQGVDLQVELEEGLPPLRCDASQIQQVAMNLLMNAAESQPRGGAVVVRTRFARDGKMAVLEVQDEGAGIPEDVLPRVFDPFFTTKEEGKGMGLGLAVVYGIVEAHGGHIDVASEPGEGTRVTVRLPLPRREEA
jgi:two-component system NtrC family sensor kinase